MSLFSSMSLSPESSSRRPILQFSSSSMTLSPETRSTRQIRPFSVGIPAHVSVVRNESAQEMEGDPMSQILELASRIAIKFFPGNILGAMLYESARKNSASTGGGYASAPIMHHTVGAFMKSLDAKLHKAVSGFEIAIGYGVGTPIAVLPGPVSHLLQSKPANDVGKPFPLVALLLKIIPFYKEAVAKLKAAGASCIQFDEPMLIMGLESHELQAYTKAYSWLQPSLAGLDVLVETYYGNVPPAAFKTLIALKGVTAIGFDLVQGPNNIDLIKNGFPLDKILFAGVVDGRSTRPNDLAASLNILHTLEGVVGKGNLVVSTSCPIFYDAVKDHVGVKEKESSWHAIAAQKFSEVAILSHQIMYSNADIQERSRTDREQKIKLVDFDLRLLDTAEELEAHGDRLKMIEEQIMYYFGDIQERRNADREQKKKFFEFDQRLLDTAEELEAHGDRLNMVEEQASSALSMHAGNNAPKKARKWLRCCSCFK